MQTFAASFDAAWLPNAPLAGQKTGPKHRMNREHALTLPYIEANPLALQSLVVVDRDASDADQIADLLGLPEPSWVALNPYTTAGHVVFALKAPVCMTDAARRAPVNKLARIEQGLTDVLGGDVAYGGRITKNPHHRAHPTRWGAPEASYSLQELSDALQGLGALPDPSKDSQALRDSSTGRNCELFDLTRTWAYSARERYSDRTEWEEVVEAVAWNKNQTWICDQFSKGPMSRIEVHHLAQSISRWVWRNITPEKTAARRAAWSTPEKQQKRGQRSGVVRAERRQKLAEQVLEVEANAR